MERMVWGMYGLTEGSESGWERDGGIEWTLGEKVLHWWHQL